MRALSLSCRARSHRNCSPFESLSYGSVICGIELNPTAENLSMPSSGVVKWEMTDFVLSHSGCMTWFGLIERSSVDLPLPLGPMMAPIPKSSGVVVVV